MPSTAAQAHTAGYDASFTLVEVEPVPAPFRVEAADGWSVSADTADELRALIAEKLRQAEQAAVDAQVAVDRWRAVAKAAG